jgi:hypothetical protein
MDANESAVRTLVNSCIEPSRESSLAHANSQRKAILQDVVRRWQAPNSPLWSSTAGVLKSVREVTVVASSSRSGSSVFSEILRQSSQFWHLSGEVNPFMRLTRLAWPESGSGSDSLGSAHCTPANARALDAYLSMEIGEPADDLSDCWLGEEFTWRLYGRLSLQWPLEEFTISEVGRWQATALKDARELRGGSFSWKSDVELFHVLFLKNARAEHPSIDPYYYDLDPKLIKAVFADLPRPVGPPGPIIIEEPPFILIRPWARGTLEDWASRPLLIKTPSNAYRLKFLQSLFPNAHFRILHLTRNPAASINGIYEGWRHWGFHSHYIGPDLKLRGYVEDGDPECGWWKFDLPPGWAEYKSSSLAEVCAFQWQSAHEFILEFIRQSGVEYRRIHFETILGSADTRLEVFKDLYDWLHLVPDQNILETLHHSLPVVMAIAKPLRCRWRANEAALWPVLQAERIREVSECLGYANEAEWV